MSELRESRNGGKKHIFFTVFAVLFAFGALIALDGAIEAVQPFYATGYMPDELRWHGGIHGSLLGIYFGIGLLAMIVRSRSGPAMLQFFIVGHFVFLSTLAATDWNLYVNKIFVTFMFLVICMTLYFCYPQRKEVFRLPKRAEYDRPLLIVAALAALMLLPAIWRTAANEITLPDGEFHWGENAALYICMLYAGWLAASRRPGSSLVGIVTGLVYVYLGAASLTISEHEGSFGIIGGIVLIVIGLIYWSIVGRNYRTGIDYSSINS